MERRRQSAAPMWVDMCGNVDADTAPFPGYSAKVSNTPNWQFQASDEPRWNGARFLHCTPSSESATPSQTQIAACGVSNQTTTTRTNHETTQHILEQMLQELDRAPLITFSPFDGPPRSMNTQHNTTTAPSDAHFLFNSRTNYAQNLPAIHSGQDRYYNPSTIFQHHPLVSSSACQYEFGRHHHDIADRQEPHVGAVHHTSLMSHGVNKPTCDLVAPAPKVLPMTDAPSQMTRSLLELARLVDNPPVYEQHVVPPPPTIVQSDRVSNAQEGKTLRKDYSAEITPGKTTQGLLPSYPKPKPPGSSINPPPRNILKDTASPVVTNQDSHKDSRRKLTTKHGSVYVDHQVVGMMNIDQAGRLVKSPVIVLERLQEDKVKSRLYQHTNKRRLTKPTQLLSYVGDSDSDADDDSSTSDYVPSECDRNSHNEDLDGSDSSMSMLDPHELEAELDSDYSETSSDTADFSTCDDENDCCNSDNNNVNDDYMSCQGDTEECGKEMRTL